MFIQLASCPASFLTTTLMHFRRTQDAERHSTVYGTVIMAPRYLYVASLC